MSAPDATQAGHIPVVYAARVPRVCLRTLHENSRAFEPESFPDHDIVAQWLRMRLFSGKDFEEKVSILFSPPGQGKPVRKQIRINSRKENAGIVAFEFLKKVGDVMGKHYESVQYGTFMIMEFRRTRPNGKTFEVVTEDHSTSQDFTGYPILDMRF